MKLRKEQKLNQTKKLKNEEKVREVLEDMCILGSIMKEEIIEEKQKNPEKFISIEEATKEEKKRMALFAQDYLQKIQKIQELLLQQKKSLSKKKNQKAAPIQFYNLL